MPNCFPLRTLAWSVRGLVWSPLRTRDSFWFCLSSMTFLPLKTPCTTGKSHKILADTQPSKDQNSCAKLWLHWVASHTWASVCMSTWVWGSAEAAAISVAPTRWNFFLSLKCLLMHWCHSIGVKWHLGQIASLLPKVRNLLGWGGKNVSLILLSITGS